MRDLNKVIFTGRLTADPELRYLASGLESLSIGIAINGVRGSGDKKKDHVDFIEIAIYGKQAENVSKYLRKGSPVLIEGRLAQQRWETNGQKRSKVGVIADNVQFLAQKTEDRGQNAESSESSRQIAEAFPGAEVVDADIPF